MCCGRFGTFFRHLLDIFPKFCHGSLCQGCPTICPLQRDPISRDPIQGGKRSPKMVRYPPLPGDIPPRLIRTSTKDCCDAIALGDKIQGASWGQQKRRKPAFWHHLDPRFKFGRKHPSCDVIFSGQNLAKKCQKLSLYMTSSNL